MDDVLVAMEEEAQIRRTLNRIMGEQAVQEQVFAASVLAASASVGTTSGASSRQSKSEDGPRGSNTEGTTINLNNNATTTVVESNNPHFVATQDQE